MEQLLDLGDPIGSLSILAEVTIAFVAFSTIVASIKMSIGMKLTPYQRILIHYFTESSMLMLSIILLTIVLLSAYPEDERWVAQFALVFSFFSMALYLFLYLRRRIRLKIPTPFISVFVIIGYFVMIILIGITISPFLWGPQVVHIAYAAFWNFVSCALIFSFFLGTFIDADKTV